MKLDPFPRFPVDKTLFERKLTDLFRAIAQECAILRDGNEFIGAQTVRFHNLIDAATIETDASRSNHFLVTLGGNRTLANPVNMRDGGIYNWWIKQDGTGSRTLSYGSKFKWTGGTAPTLTTAAGRLDLIVCQYNETLDILACAVTPDVR